MVKDFSKGKIYKLTAGDLTYYGSTIETLDDRFSKHKCDSNGCSSKKLFKSGKEVKIELVEDYPCKNEEELFEREGYYQKNFECVNKRIAGRTKRQYYEDNRDEILEKQKQYAEDNKETKAEYKKQYYKNNREAIAEKKKQWYEDNKEIILEKKKQYREDNKKAIAEYHKQYQENNKNKLNAYYSEKIQCECGVVVSRRGISTHRKSQKHKKYIDSL